MRRTIAIVLLFAVLLSGCALAPKRSALSKTGSIQVLMLGGAGFDTTLITAFTKVFPQIKVEPVQIPSGDFAAIVENLKQGLSGIDVVVAPGSAYLFTSGALIPLDGLVAQKQIPLTGFGETIELGRYKGKLYGLPVSVSPMMVIYNRDLLEKANVPVPLSHWTWSQFETAVNSLAAIDAPAMKAGLALPPSTFVDMLLTSGEGPHGTDLSAMEENLARIATFLATERALLPFAETADDSTMFAAFADGQYGMLLNYWGYSFAHKKPEFSYGIAPMPGLDESDAAPGIGTLAMVTAGSKNQEAAFTFAQFIAGAEGARNLATLPGAPIPAYIDAGLEQQWLSHASLRPESIFLVRQNYIPIMDYPEEIVPLLLNEVDQALTGSKTPREAMAAFKKAREPFLSK